MLVIKRWRGPFSVWSVPRKEFRVDGGIVLAIGVEIEPLLGLRVVAWFMAMEVGLPYTLEVSKIRDFRIGKSPTTGKLTGPSFKKQPICVWYVKLRRKDRSRFWMLSLCGGVHPVPVS